MDNSEIVKKQRHTENGECTSDCRRYGCPEEYDKAMNDTNVHTTVANEIEIETIKTIPAEIIDDLLATDHNKTIKECVKQVDDAVEAGKEWPVDQLTAAYYSVVEDIRLRIKGLKI